MFCRRVVGSGAIPRTMYRNLHISNAGQASRMVPPLVPVTSLFSSSVAQVQALSGATAISGGLETAQPLEKLNLCSFLTSTVGFPGLQFLNSVAPHPLLIRIISDMTMISTYSPKCLFT